MLYLRIKNKYMKAKIKIKNKITNEILEFPNEIFNKDNGVAFFEIDKEWELLEVNQFVCTIKKIDIYENDKVLVKGKKSIGNYETEVIRDLQGWTLKENKTYLNDNKCFMAIIQKL